jgi:hypothetical protein
MSKADQEYHLIDLEIGITYGGFESLEAARIIAREHALKSWQIFHGNIRVEHHDPEVREEIRRSYPSLAHRD